MRTGGRGLLIVGAGGHGEVVLDVAKCSGRFADYLFLDENPAERGTHVQGVEVAGSHELLSRLDKADWDVIVAVGDNEVRRRLAAQIDELGWGFASVTHPSATVAEAVEVSPGVVVCAGAVVNPGAHLGAHAIVNSRAVVEHDCSVGAYAHIAPGSCLGGGVQVGSGALIGIRAAVLPGTRIGDFAVVGAGASVIKDVSERAVVVGVPAREIRRETIGVERVVPSSAHPRRRGGTVAVTGVGGGVGLPIVRALRASHLSPEIVGFDARSDSVGFLWCDHGRVVPYAEDPSYVETVLSTCQELGVEVLIPGSDPELLPLAEAKPVFKEAGIETIVSAPDAIRVARDKHKTWRFCEENGLPFARTALGSDARRLAGEVGFPLIIKPIGGSATRDVSIAQAPSDLQSLAGRDDFIVQEYLLPTEWLTRDGTKHPGESHLFANGSIRQEDEISIQLLFDPSGEELGAFASRNRLTNGVPVLIEPLQDEGVIGKGRELARSLLPLGLIGPCNIQGRITEEGLRFFEINLRFTGITAMRTEMGFREVDAVLDRIWKSAPLASARAQLASVRHSACMRYVTEAFMPPSDLRRLRETGEWMSEDHGT